MVGGTYDGRLLHIQLVYSLQHSLSSPRHSTSYLAYDRVNFCQYSRAIRLRQSTTGAETRQESVFQINDGFSNQIISTNDVIIHDANAQVFDDRDCSVQFKDPKEKNAIYFFITFNKEIHSKRHTAFYIF